MSNIIDYMKLPSIGGSNPSIEISRDGRFILFASNETGKLNLYVQSIENPADIKRISPADRMVYTGRFSPDGKHVCYMSELHGNETHDLFLVDLATPEQEAKKITSQALKSYDRGLGWSPDGLEVARSFTAGANSGVEIINIATGESQVLIENVPPLMSLRYSHCGDWLACTVYEGVSRILLVNRHDPTKTKTIRLSETCANAGPSWSQDDSKLGFITNINGFFQPVIYDLQTDQHTLIELDAGEESLGYVQVALEMVFHPDGECVYYAVSKSGRKYIYERNLSTGEKRILPFPDGSVEPFQLSADGRLVVALHSSMKSPRMAYKYELESPTAERLTRQEHQDMLDQLPYPTLISIESFDGRQINSWYLAAARKTGETGPALVIPHGGPSQHSCDEWFEGLYYQAFAMAGFSVIVPNYRGSTGHGNEFFRLNVGDVGGGDLKDVVAAATWLSQQSGVDPARVGILGASYGGYLTLMAMAQYAEHFKAGVSIVPAVDWDYQYGVSDQKYQNYIRYLFDGAPDEKKELYTERSIPAHAEKIRAPLLVIAGANDYRCPVKPIQDLEKTLEKNNVTRQFVIKGAEGHMSMFNDVEEQIKDLFTMLAFLQKYL